MYNCTCISFYVYMYCTFTCGYGDALVDTHVAYSIKRYKLHVCYKIWLFSACTVHVHCSQECIHVLYMYTVVKSV